jgi:hypothetical protein
MFISYEVSLLIANTGKQHTIAEEQIDLLLKQLHLECWDTHLEKEYNLISFSNSTVKQ